jgi:hypothetical protein
MRPDLFLHFEMIPDRLPDSLRTLITQFPPGSLQFEVGIQSFDPEVQKLISRRQDNERMNEPQRTCAGCVPRPTSTSTPT